MSQTTAVRGWDAMPSKNGPSPEISTTTRGPQNDGGTSRRQGRVHHRRRARSGPQSRGAAGAGGRRHHRGRHLRADQTARTRSPPSTPEDLAETADLVKGRNRRIVTAEVDVRDYDALKAAVDSGVEQFGRLDIIVANAGIGNGGQTLDKTSEDDWNDMIDVNLSGVWKTVKAGVPHYWPAATAARSSSPARSAA